MEPVPVPVLVQRVLLVKSPLDAMSLVVMDRAQRGPEGVSIYLSTDGSGGVSVEALKMLLRGRGAMQQDFEVSISLINKQNVGLYAVEPSRSLEMDY
ncbi:MAG: hypothetical protein ACFE0J_08590 [Elainellaceae cyanobacterium]